MRPYAGRALRNAKRHGHGLESTSCTQLISGAASLACQMAAGGIRSRTNGDDPPPATKGEGERPVFRATGPKKWWFDGFMARRRRQQRRSVAAPSWRKAAASTRSESSPRQSTSRRAAARYREGAASERSSKGKRYRADLRERSVIISDDPGGPRVRDCSGDGVSYATSWSRSFTGQADPGVSRTSWNVPFTAGDGKNGELTRSGTPISTGFKC